MTASPLRLGVPIDHVAALRAAQGGVGPDPVRAALLAEAAGADSITVSLCKDRRRIAEADIERLMAALRIPLRIEMAPTADLQALALRHRPQAVCIVPEPNAGADAGLDVASDEARLRDHVAPLRAAGCRVSLSIGHDPRQIESAARTGAAVVELHTGHYANLHAAGRILDRDQELRHLMVGAALASSLGLEVHMGHGLTYDTVQPAAAAPEVVELHIGHFLIGEAVFVGLGPAIAEMRRLMDEARAALG